MPTPKAELSIDRRQRLRMPENNRTWFKPLRHTLMIRPLPVKTKQGNIFLPDRSQTETSEGHIIDLGPECTTGVALGDLVVWEMNSETIFDIDGDKITIVHENNVILLIPKATLDHYRTIHFGGDKLEGPENLH